MTYASYERCYKCSGRAQPGTVALLKYLLLKFPYTKSLGIYNCRPISGTSVLSNHSCGLAIDLGIPMAGSAARTDLGDPIVVFLDSVSSTIGLTEQIYNRVRYTASYPRGKYYGGVSPHRDHNHMSISKVKGLSLTFDQIVAVAGQPIPEGDDEMTLKRGDKGVAVARFQKAMMAEKAGALPNFGADADFGGETEAAVKDFQARTDLAQTGQVDCVTGALLLESLDSGGTVDAYTKAQSNNRYAPKAHTHPDHAPQAHAHTATTTSSTVVK